MLNIYQSQPAKIVKIKQEAPKIKLFRLMFVNSELRKNFFWQPGQFIQLGIPGFGEAPFAPCSSCQEKKFFEICVRQVGQLTTKLHQLKVGDLVYIRGPFGRGYPEVKEERILLVAGGLGMIPLRSFILNWPDKISQIILFYGARQPTDFLFKGDFKKWQKAGLKLYLTIDKFYSGWKGYVGVVTVLFDKVFPQLPIEQKPNLAILCGPSIMYKFVLEKLHQFGFKDENIYLSLERRMHCGVGICQHCAIGPYYVCKDGPVFRYSEIREIAGAI
jgi:NAD(P)H-flavin reductase